MAGLARGRARFNRAEFWASHEAFEMAWAIAEPADKDLFKGLIKAGAAFHKLIVQDNPGGALRLLDASLAHLAPWPEAHMGLALRPFTAQLRLWRDRLEAAAGGHGSIQGLPRLDWTPELERRALGVRRASLHELRLGDRRCLLIELVDEAGRRGWGECLWPWGHHGLWSALTSALLPALLSESLLHPAEFPILGASSSDDDFARAGLEGAVWDLWARQRDLPLTRAMGLEPRRLPRIGRARSLDPAGLRAEIDALRTEGYPHLLLPARPNADRRLLPGLVADMDRPWSVDLGRAYHRADLRVLEAIDRLGPAWLAEPVAAEDVSGAQRICRRLERPVARGGWRGTLDLAGAMRLGSADIALIDPQICGPTAALNMLDLAGERDFPAGIGGRATSPVGAALVASVAVHPAACLPVDLGPVLGYDGRTHMRPDSQGCVGPPEGMGIGPPPPAEWIMTHRCRTWQIGA